MLDHAIFWHVYPSATGARIRDWTTEDEGTPPAGPHPLARLPHRPRLQRPASLPIFASSTHGYDTLDHFQIDPRLGDDADFDRLMAACRERGIEVVLDGVFNHVGINHPMVAGDGPIRRLADGSPEPWEGHGDLALLNHEDPRTEDLVVDVMNHWLDRGIAGWRLDVAYAVPTWFGRCRPRPARTPSSSAR